jgi:hypothetical protein
VREALRCAESVLEAAAAAGVGLGIGVTVGPIEPTRDLLEDNVAGIAINQAARLAFLEGNDGCIAVDEEVVRLAVRAGPYRIVDEDKVVKDTVDAKPRTSGLENNGGRWFRWFLSRYSRKAKPNRTESFGRLQAGKVILGAGGSGTNCSRRCIGINC